MTTSSYDDPDVIEIVAGDLLISDRTFVVVLNASGPHVSLSKGKLHPWEGWRRFRKSYGWKKIS